MSHRYITDRQLPDKAIDLIDEAASRIKMEIDSKPEALDKLDRRLIQLKMQLEAVKQDADSVSKAEVEYLEKQLLLYFFLFFLIDKSDLHLQHAASLLLN